VNSKRNKYLLYVGLAEGVSRLTPWAMDFVHLRKELETALKQEEQYFEEEYHSLKPAERVASPTNEVLTVIVMKIIERLLKEKGFQQPSRPAAWSQAPGSVSSASQQSYAGQPIMRSPDLTMSGQSNSNPSLWNNVLSMFGVENNRVLQTVVSGVQSIMGTPTPPGQPPLQYPPPQPAPPTYYNPPVAPPMRHQEDIRSVSHSQRVQEELDEMQQQNREIMDSIETIFGNRPDPPSVTKQLFDIPEEASKQETKCTQEPVSENEKEEKKERVCDTVSSPVTPGKSSSLTSAWQVGGLGAYPAEEEWQTSDNDSEPLGHA
jgi:hypothetical protein